MRGRSTAAIMALGLALCAAGASAETKKPARAQPGAALDCPRAAYKGDPVCFGAAAADDLPLPSAHAVPREKSDAVQLSDEVSVSGSDPKALAKPPVQLNNPNPNPRRQDMGGGAAVNYKF